jgi:hypothetical protein
MTKLIVAFRSFANAPKNSKPAWYRPGDVATAVLNLRLELLQCRVNEVSP